MPSLTEAIRRTSADPEEPVFLLSEVKARSPRDGDLLDGRDPGRLAAEMRAAGAGGISVVTESEHFGGDLDLLEAVRDSVEAPILAKDFFETHGAIDAAAEAGAEAVLLIGSELEPERLEDLVEHCRSVGVDPLVETHTREEVGTADDIGARLVGINNRDIGELELDDGGVERTERLAPVVREDAAVVSESSLSSAAEVRRAVEAGADAVLIGTAILQAPDLAEAVRELSLRGEQG